MKIDVHDFPGHAFPVQLSRALAERGHDVIHWWSPDVASGRGALELRASDPPSLRLAEVSIGREFARYRVAQRLRDEHSYGRAVVQAMSQARRPDVVISANSPITVQSRLSRMGAKRDVAFVFWLQDVLSVGSASELRKRLGPAGGLAGRALTEMERASLRRSDHVVAITSAFEELLNRWGVGLDRRTVIENWTPLAEVPVLPHDTEWRRAHGLAGKPVFLYAGTLGLKHDPAALLAVAEAVVDRATVVVVSEGLGAEWLRRNGAHLGDGLRVLPFQPWEVLPEVLASADVLLSLLEPEAGVYSVPSKVLTGHAAGRAQLAAIPADNLAARIIVENGSGLVTSPGDHVGLADAALALLENEERRGSMGRAARRYAEKTFDIEGIANTFEMVFAKALAHRMGETVT